MTRRDGVNVEEVVLTDVESSTEESDGYRGTVDSLDEGPFVFGG